MRFFLPFSAAVLIFVLTIGVKGDQQWGQCTCKCIIPECDFPKTDADCKKCADLASGSNRTKKYSMDEGHCWVHVADVINEAPCDNRVFRSLAGCSGFSGYTWFPGGQGICWATWNKP